MFLSDRHGFTVIGGLGTDWIRLRKMWYLFYFTYRKKINGRNGKYVKSNAKYLYGL